MISIPAALILFGLSAILLGLWVNRRLMRTTGNYRSESETESGRLAADRAAGLAIFQSWLLIAVGPGALALAVFLEFWVRI